MWTYSGYSVCYLKILIIVLKNIKRYHGNSVGIAECRTGYSGCDHSFPDRSVCWATE